MSIFLLGFQFYFLMIKKRLRAMWFGKNGKEIIVEIFHERNIIIVKDSQSQ